MFWPGNGLESGKSWNLSDDISSSHGAREPRISANPLALLDVCHSHNGDELLVEAVMQSLGALSRDGVLKLLTPHVPDMLEGELAEHGFQITSRLWREDTWDIEISGPHTPNIADLRELEAPEPMQHVLTAASQLDGDKTYFARLPHVPHPLFPVLQERGLQWWVHEEDDHSALLALRAGR